MRASRSFYRSLLRLCPRELRVEFGAEMKGVFLADLERAKGLAKARAWWNALADVIRHGLGARHDARARLAIGLAASLLGIALIAVLAPALSAMRVDPVAAPRSQ